MTANHAALRELAELLKLEVEIYGPRIPKSPRSLMLTAAEALRTAASEGGEAFCYAPEGMFDPRFAQDHFTVSRHRIDKSQVPLFTHPPEVARDAGLVAHPLETSHVVSQNQPTLGDKK